MQAGKSKSSQKTREPYGKVTEVGQVPVALQELKELAKRAADFLSDADVKGCDKSIGQIYYLTDSIIAVTCANPGCLSQMAENENMEVR